MKIRAVSLDKARKHNYYDKYGYSIRCKDNKKTGRISQRGPNKNFCLYNELGRPGAKIAFFTITIQLVQCSR